MNESKVSIKALIAESQMTYEELANEASINLLTLRKLRDGGKVQPFIVGRIIAALEKKLQRKINIDDVTGIDMY